MAEESSAKNEPEAAAHKIEKGSSEEVSELTKNVSAIISDDSSKLDINGADQKTANDNFEGQSPNTSEVAPNDSAENNGKHKDSINDPVLGVDIAKDSNQPIENGTSTQPEPPSKRVQEGQRWNNRNRDGPDSKKNNIKSDVTSQEESSDPVAIRKQVSNLQSSHELNLTLFTR